MRGTEAVEEPTSTAGSSDSTLPVVQAATEAASRMSAPPKIARTVAFRRRMIVSVPARPFFAIGRLRSF